MRLHGKSSSICLDCGRPHPSLFFHCCPLPTHMHTHTPFFQSWSFEKGFYFSWKMVSLYIHPPLECVVFVILRAKKLFPLWVRKELWTLAEMAHLLLQPELGHPLLQQGFLGACLVIWHTATPGLKISSWRQGGGIVLTNNIVTFFKRQTRGCPDHLASKKAFRC